ncbi:YTH domain-containing protein ECT3 isoform X2 [Hevea brasiliensis]|nr:YTH domain-containing protein ECT3 isoform X2 [Hevea brasiliensis]
MYNEGSPEFFVDQGLYYPTATNYGYYCTGSESPGEWEDHHRIFGADGPEIQYAGAQTESLPYVYYTLSYGYGQSPYNPYNPYIPGAMIGVDGPYVGAQQYYAMPPYKDTVCSPGYVPVVVQPDFVPNNSTNANPLLDAAGLAFTNRPDGRSLKHGLASSSAAFPKHQTKPTSNQTNTMPKISEGPRSNAIPSKQSLTQGSVSFGSFPTSASVHMLQGRGASGSIQPVDNFSCGKVLPHSNQLKVAVPVNNGFSDFGSSAPGQAVVAKLRSNTHAGRTLNDLNGGPDALSEQNRGPRTNKSRNHFAVKAYTTKVGDNNAQGNIIIYTDQYNKDEFPVDYIDAKFFVIKSYSEDDVHKSIKYSVWSSTPHGNKKLQSAYEDTQKIAAGKPRAFPIFLFFSVNASGQFCGVAEMIGPVDFLKDMDFWQQDKWSGSFPVKWHIIKDVPNSSFRHIMLENNENKPVTNSRDTQEIMYKQGVEILKIFKSHISKTSLIDDFMYYENRQRIMQEEKARLIFKSFETPFLVPASDPAHKLDCLVELAPKKDEKTMEQNSTNCMKKTEAPSTEQVSSNSDAADTSVESEISGQTIVKSGSDIASVLKIGSLSIKPKHDEPKPSSDVATCVSSSDPVGVVTVGSMSVKVNGFAESSGILRVGSIPLDPRALQL